jgi:hypothetical protein
MIRRWEWGDAKELDSWIEYSREAGSGLNRGRCRKACGLWFRISQPVEFHFVLQSRPADAQSLGGVRNVAAGFGQSIRNGSFLDQLGGLT